jgi:hypothetical protein
MPQNRQYGPSMKTDLLWQTLNQWQAAVKLCEELAAQAKREILAQSGDKRTREERAKVGRSVMHEPEIISEQNAPNGH